MKKVWHHEYEGKVYEQSADEILEFIKDYEDCIPMNCYFGTYCSYSIPTWTYSRPELCCITYRLKDEKIPTK